MTDDEPAPRKLELSPAQVAGSALAAVSGAVLASWLGTTGTIVGAALGSVIATVGATAYTYSLRRTSAVVRRTAAQVRETGMASTVVIPRISGHRPQLPQPIDGSDESDAEPGARTDDGNRPEGDDEGRFAVLRSLPWVKVALTAAAVMVVAMAGITAFEAVTGKPVSAYTRGGSSTGTSVNGVLGLDHSPKKAKPTETPSPIPSPSESVSPSGSPSASPSESPSSAPSEVPTSTPTPTIPSTPSPTVEPSPVTPTP
jgi:hypothetical protein